MKCLYFWLLLLFLLFQCVSPLSECLSQKLYTEECEIKILKFETNSCTWCEKLNNELKDIKIPNKFIIVSVKDNNLSKKYMIRNYPTLVFINKSGKELKRIIGYRTKSELLYEMQNM